MSLTLWAVLILILLIVPIGHVFGEIPSEIEPDTGTDASDYTFHLLDNDTYVNFNINPYSNTWFIHGNHVNFTTAALSGVNYPTKSFGIGVENGNTTITTVDADSVVLDMSCTDAMRCDAQYYYAMPVQAVNFDVNGADTDILAGSFYTDFALFDAAPAPAVYHNATGNYIQAKVTFTDPTTITIDSGVFIYADMGSEKNIPAIRIYKPNLDTIPRNINVYVSNDPNAWGNPVSTNHTLTQEVGYETVDIADTDGRYVKLEVNTFGEADFIQVADFNIDVVTDQVTNELGAFQSAMFTAFLIAIVAILLVMILPRVL